MVVKNKITGVHNIFFDVVFVFQYVYFSIINHFIQDQILRNRSRSQRLLYKYIQISKTYCACDFIYICFSYITWLKVNNHSFTLYDMKESTVMIGIIPSAPPKCNWKMRSLKTLFFLQFYIRKDYVPLQCYITV